MMDALLMANEAQRTFFEAQRQYPANSMATVLNKTFWPRAEQMIAGPYESPTMNHKLAAAKQWLAERR